jgi:hypothetical protein
MGILFYPRIFALVVLSWGFELYIQVIVFCVVSWLLGSFHFFGLILDCGSGGGSKCFSLRNASK